MSAGFDLTAPAGVRLLLARHGQTPSNVAGIVDTVPPGPGLTDQGREQAEQLAERASGEKVVVLHASRALRAQQTAQPLARRLGMPVEILDGIHEIQAGELEGSQGAAQRKEFEDIYASWHAGRIDEPMPGGETGRQALTRFAESAQRALSDAETGTVVLVSHGAILRLFAGQLVPGLDGTRVNAAHLPNAGTITLESAGAGTGWRCPQWDGLI